MEVGSPCVLDILGGLLGVPMVTAPLEGRGGCPPLSLRGSPARKESWGEPSEERDRKVPVAGLERDCVTDGGAEGEPVGR